MKQALRSRLSAMLASLVFLQVVLIQPIMAQEQGTPLPTSRPASLTDAVSSATVEGAPENPYTDAVTGATVDTSGEANPDAVSGATAQGGRALSPNFLGLDVSVNAHKATGYAAGGLFLAAGVVGGIRFFDLMNRSHEYRTDGEGEDDEFTAACRGVIRTEWADGQTLRWMHVGLIGAGESLYLFDAVTGMSMIKKGTPPTRAGRIHRTAFFVHAGLMVAEMVLGFLTTDALQRGDHEMIIKLGAAHTGIGVAIPAVILGSGLAIDLYPGMEVKH